MSIKSEIELKIYNQLKDSETYQGKDIEFARPFIGIFSDLMESVSFHIQKTRQEIITQTAVQNSSIYLKASDALYEPVKPKPATGLVSITNNDNTPFQINELELKNDDSSALLIVREFIELEPLETRSFPVEQLNKSTEIHSSQGTTYEEFVIGDINSVSEYQILVNGSNIKKSDLSDLTQSRNLLLTFTEKYDQFGQIFIRFGNNIAYNSLNLNDEVTIVVYQTDGADFSLASGVNLFKLSSTITQDLTIQTSSAINGGTNLESIESIKKSIPLAYTAASGVVLPSHFEKIIERQFSRYNFILVKFWGEQEEEAVNGQNQDNIGKKFFTILSPLLTTEQENLDFGQEAINYLNTLEVQNKEFEFIPIVKKNFFVSISGKIERSKSISESISLLKSTIFSRYSFFADPDIRIPRPTQNGLYKIIESTGIFDDDFIQLARNDSPFFEVSISGDTSIVQNYDIVGLNSEDDIDISIEQVIR